MLAIAVVPLIGFIFINDVLSLQDDSIFDATSTKYRSYIEFVYNNFQFNEFSRSYENPKQDTTLEVMIDLKDKVKNVSLACNNVRDLVLVTGEGKKVQYKDVCLKNYTTKNCLFPEECFKPPQIPKENSTDKHYYIYLFWSVDTSNENSDKWLEFICFNIGFPNFNYEVYYQMVTKVTAYEGKI